jgi:hypothetical protein
MAAMAVMLESTRNDLKFCTDAHFLLAASKLGGPVEFVTAYTGRGLFLFLRGLDKFLTLYDGLMELKPLETVHALPL